MPPSALYGTMAFVRPLRAEYLGAGEWMLSDTFLYDSALIGRVEVPKGMVTDLASVPRWFPIAYAMAGGRAHPAAVIHDFLYGTHRVDRATADAVFLEAMAAIGEPVWRREAMYRAVRLFAWRAYAKGPARLRMLNSDPAGDP